MGGRRHFTWFSETEKEMIMQRSLVSALAVALILAGCASGVKRMPSASPAPAHLSPDSQVASVSVSLTDEAKKKAAENRKFNSIELLRHVKRALQAHSLVDGSPDKSLPNLEIQVKDMRVRSSLSAVVFGFMAGADSVTADVVLKDLEGKELDRFEVSASYALGGTLGGRDSIRMEWLYEKFAEHTVKELTKQ